LSDCCRRADKGDWAYLESLGSHLRKIGERLDKTRARFLRDIQLWRDFVSKDGKGKGFSDLGTLGGIVLKAEMFGSKGPATNVELGCCGETPADTPACQLWRVVMPADVRARIPELADIEGDGAHLEYELGQTPKQPEQGFASGAGPSAGP
jgi:hypothetical protein